MFTLEKASNEVKTHIICVNYYCKQIFKVEPGQSDASGFGQLRLRNPGHYIIIMFYWKQITCFLQC